MDYGSYEFVRELKERLQVSQAYRDDKFSNARRPGDMQRYFVGDHYASGMVLDTIDTRDQVVVNYSQRNVLLKTAQIAYGPPSFRIVGKDQASRDRSGDQKRYLEYVWKEIKAPKATRRVFLDAKIVGTGIVATGWRMRTRFRSMNPTEGPKSLRPRSQRAAEEREILVDQPTVRRVDPNNILFDPDSPDDIQEGWWIGEKFILPLGRMREMKKYSSVINDLRGDTHYPEQYRNVRVPDSDSDALRAVTIYRFYLREYGVQVEYTEEMPDQLLWVGEEPLIHYPMDLKGVGYFPYVRLKGIPDLDSAYGIGDIEVMETQQVEIDAGRSQLAARRRTDGTIYLADATALGEENMNDIQDAQDRQVIQVVNMGSADDLKKLLVAAERQPVQPELYSSLSESKADMSILLGISMDERGAPMGANFATEAAMVSRSADVRKAVDRTDYEEFVAETGMQVATLCHHFGDEQVDVPMGDGEFQQVRGVDLAGAYEFRVEPASMEPPSDLMEEQMWGQRLQLLSGFIPMGVNIKPLLERYLAAMNFDHADEVLAAMGSQPPIPIMEGESGAEGAPEGEVQPGGPAPDAGESERAAQEVASLITGGQSPGGAGE